MLLVIYYHFDCMKETFLFPPLHMPNKDIDKLQSTDYTEQNVHGQ